MVVTQVQELDPYFRLAEVLDRIPNGFTKTEDGSHLKILQWIFTPEEADLASKMKLMAETVEELSTRLDIPMEGLEDKLENMVKRGQIQGLNTSTGKRYGLIPFAVGVYEEQLDRMDKELAMLVEDWFEKSKYKDLFGTEPAIFKVIPINRVIKPELEIYPYEIAEEIIKRSKSWGIRECICKKHQGLLGKFCQYPSKVCLNFAKKENAFDNSELTKAITMDKALEYLRESEEAGLIHCSMNIQSGHSYICNCCTCCCGVLRALTERDQPHAFVNSNFLMSVAEEECSGCETCVDRCQFDALEVNKDEICEVDVNRCVGCGVCAISCPEEALGLIARDSSEKTIPIATFNEWMTQKAASRNVDPSDLM
ncbi:MAG: ATP-binding protein [Candidatus Hodarchaeales archaeon]|jgi:Pyruvate/2-oxoacid:ferredoxin oxidoreductase delta subunit